MQLISQTDMRGTLSPTHQRDDVCIPVSVIIAARNESRNLPRCLQSLSKFAEVYVVDSQSTDNTQQIANEYGTKLVEFHYRGGWPKKRQWAMDTLPLENDWIMLLDADETIPHELQMEIRQAIKNPQIDGYYISLHVVFLDRVLRHCGATFEKLCLFRRSKGRFECRLKDQDISMCDMEVHEHVVVKGRTANLKSHIDHHNVESLSRSIQKHNDYSNWEAAVVMNRADHDEALTPSLLGSQAQRRRWLKKKLFGVPGFPVFLFLYRYLFRLGFLDGVPGLIYCSFQAIQTFQIKAKIYELKLNSGAKKD